ncbi:uncharacterized protein LOC122195450 [Lactuca sativa]|uniref:uncharacterized protein LOC122195450 n=1 Tax=Lactuca sativa TaxID=4236 RepID=UPI001C687AE8|nr:uncharacterized protein LOC122195450 [Lactuca sativa]
MIDIEGFDDVVRHSWAIGVESNNSWVRFKKKLQFLKSNIQVKNSSSRIRCRSKRKMLQDSLESIDARIIEGDGSASLRELRVMTLKELNELDHLSNVDLAQKAKVKWGIEGGENSGHFHVVVNRKRHQLAIRGIFIDGVWVDDPGRSPFSREEIKRVVWDCGSSKAPGLDGFSFGFIKRYWDLHEDDVVDFVLHFYHHSSIPKGSNASFFTVIPKIWSLVKLK